MPIELFTGLPGSGKTAQLVEHLMGEAAKKDPRPLVAFGIEGLTPGLATILPDPKLWNEVDPAGVPDCDCDVRPERHSHVVPNGAMVYVDEAWKWFGHLHDASRQATPPHVLALAEHRHRGIDFVWSTQVPGQIYPFARGMIATHHHVVRRFGSKMIDVFKWEELNDDVKSVSKRENAQRTTRAIPSASFGNYKSASEHTIKMRLPWKVWALPLMVVLAIGLGWFAYSKLKPGARGHGSEEASAGTVPPASMHGDSEGPKYATPQAYAIAHQPRIATIPGSAPIFDDREVTANPQLFCMSSGDDGRDACACMTEQATVYALPNAECRMIARHGAPYDPYKQRDDNRSSTREAFQEQPPSRAASTAQAGVMEAPQIASYGDLGDRDITAADGGSLGM